MKYDLNDIPCEYSNNQQKLNGIYAKISSIPPSRAGRIERAANGDDVNLKVAFFLMQGTVMIWGHWILKDAPVRLAYSTAVARVCDEIRKDVNDGKYFSLEELQKRP